MTLRYPVYTTNDRQKIYEHAMRVLVPHYPRHRSLTPNVSGCAQKSQRALRSYDPYTLSNKSEPHPYEPAKAMSLML